MIGASHSHATLWPSLASSATVSYGPQPVLPGPGTALHRSLLFDPNCNPDLL